MSQALRVLAVDDSPEGLFALEGVLKQSGFSVTTATNGAEALRAIESEPLDAIILDLAMPGVDGFTVTEKVKSDDRYRYIPLLILTANTDLDSLTRVLDAGADTYVAKPYRPDELIARLHALVRSRSVFSELKISKEENRKLRDIVEERTSFDKIVGKSPSMRAIYELINKVKDADVPVLITGASGTGKELIAHAIHFNSARKNRPFVAQNCSALNENLLEAELFGYVRGAFTGANKDKAGLFETADGGTFFLDELGEMSPALQVKLLRVLQDGSFTPVGGTSTKRVNVRVVAATNRNLKEMIDEGKFRADLFYRLNVISITLPPLCERREDIPLLAERFLENAATRSGKVKKALSPGALKALLDYGWPGNIRELQNEMERVNVLVGDQSVVGPEDLSAHLLLSNVGSGPASIGATDIQGTLDEAVQSLERTLIESALKKTAGNKSEAARVLGISRTNLIKKAKDYGFGE